jgi:hypothetical protein
MCSAQKLFDPAGAHSVTAVSSCRPLSAKQQGTQTPFAQNPYPASSEQNAFSGKDPYDWENIYGPHPFFDAPDPFEAFYTYYSQNQNTSNGPTPHGQNPFTRGP